MPAARRSRNERVVPGHHALTQHHEQRQREYDHRHRRRRTRHRAALDVDEHQEGNQHRDVGHALDQGAAERGWILPRDGRAAQLLARRGDEGCVAGQIDRVRHAARQIRSGDLGHRPDDVGELHRRETDREQDQRAPRDRAGSGVHQQHAEGEQHQAVERDVALRQDELEHVRVALGRGRRADHEEPEECAESQHQDRRVECEASPLHTHSGRPDRGEDGGEQKRIETEEEDVADRRERVDAEEPVRRVQQVAGRVDPQRGREESPGALHRLSRACQAATVASKAEPTLAGKSEKSLKTSNAAPPPPSENVSSSVIGI